MSTSVIANATRAAGIDSRAPRFVAAVTTVVLAIVLLTGNAWVLAAQAAVFAVGAFAGLKASPYGRVYARVIRPRLGPPKELEAPAPLRFAQSVGLTFTVIALVAFAAGAPVLGYIVVGAALAAAFLNAAFGLCLGCEVYLSFRRFIPSSPSHPIPNPEVSP